MTTHSAFAAEPGTIGVAVNQLYSEQQPTKRGAFMVRRVDPSSAPQTRASSPAIAVLRLMENLYSELTSTKWQARGSQGQPEV